MKITVAGPRDADGQIPVREVEVPALPAVGDHISFESGDGLSGYVRERIFYWDDRDELEIEVRIA